MIMRTCVETILKLTNRNVGCINGLSHCSKIVVLKFMPSNKSRNNKQIFNTYCTGVCINIHTTISFPTMVGIK